MGSMTGTIVAAVIALPRDRDTAQMGADSQQNKPLGLLDSIRVRLRVTKGRQVNGGLPLDLFWRPVFDEQRLSPVDQQDIYQLFQLAHADWLVHSKKRRTAT